MHLSPLLLAVKKKKRQPLFQRQLQWLHLLLWMLLRLRPTQRLLLQMPHRQHLQLLLLPRPPTPLSALLLMLQKRLAMLLPKLAKLPKMQ